MVVSNVFYFAETWSLPLYSEDERFNVRADRLTEVDKTSRRRDRRMLHQKKKRTQRREPKDQRWTIYDHICADQAAPQERA